MNEHRVRILGALFALLYLSFVVRKLRKQQLSVNRSLLWLASGAVLLGLSVFPQPLMIVSRWAGFEVPANAVFVLWLLILTTVLFSQTLTQSRHDDQLRRLVQENALLRAAAHDRTAKEDARH